MLTKKIQFTCYCLINKFKHGFLHPNQSEYIMIIDRYLSELWFMFSKLVCTSTWRMVLQLMVFEHRLKRDFLKKPVPGANIINLNKIVLIYIVSLFYIIWNWTSFLTDVPDRFSDESFLWTQTFLEVIATVFKSWSIGDNEKNTWNQCNLSLKLNLGLNLSRISL